MIEGDLTKVTPVFGQGPVDALMNAMMFIKRFNDEMREVASGAKPHKAVSPPSPRHRHHAHGAVLAQQRLDELVHLRQREPHVSRTGGGRPFRPTVGRK
jgi:hypothetical protein